MRKPQKCNIEYCGYGNPRTGQELEFELLGLETAIKIAEKRISELKQSRLLVGMMQDAEVSEDYIENEIDDDH